MSCSRGMNLECAIPRFCPVRSGGKCNRLGSRICTGGFYRALTAACLVTSPCLASAGIQQDAHFEFFYSHLLFSKRRDG